MLILPILRCFVNWFLHAFLAFFPFFSLILTTRADISGLHYFIQNIVILSEQPHLIFFIIFSVLCPLRYNKRTAADIVGMPYTCSGLKKIIKTKGS